MISAFYTSRQLTCLLNFGIAHWRTPYWSTATTNFRVLQVWSSLWKTKHYPQQQACVSSLTTGGSGPALSSRSSRSPSMMSVSKSWLVWSIGLGLAFLHPLTNVGTGRAAEVGAGRERGADSKLGGSDDNTEEMLLLRGSSSTAASFTGGGNAAGACVEAGRGTVTPPSCVSWGTSTTQLRENNRVIPSSLAPFYLILIWSRKKY